MSTEPPPRPSSLEDLGFERRDPVVWLSATALLNTARHLVISKMFGNYADKRELLGSMPDPGIRDYSGRPELWIDYVADLGDGFDATYSIASLLASDLDIAGPDGALHATRRGDVLVMGGDEVYPSASIDQYENRTVGPYRAALPYVEERPPDLFALPGNHDWYDGLTAWLRTFAQGKPIGAWQTHQSRSYFALELPHRWWLWGIDVQFDTYIDAPQLDYFRGVASERVQPGDQIILCSATPEWVDGHRDDPESFRTLDYFERKVIAPTGAVLRVAMAGNAHHYAHYGSEDGDLHRFTSGGGGAYLSATHDLPERIALPPDASIDRRKTTPSVGYRRIAAHPDAATSARLGRGVWRLALLNRAFVGLIGAVYAFYAWASLSLFRSATAAVVSLDAMVELMRSYGVATRDVGFAGAVLGLVGRPVSLVVSLGLAATLFGLTKRHGVRRLVVGLTHLVVQATALVAVLTGTFAIVGEWPASSALAGALALSFLLGGPVGTLVLAAYLAFGDRFGRNANEQFSALHIEDHKNFLRLHIGQDGALTVFSVALPAVVHRWRTDPQGRDDGPWLLPDGETLTPELIETPTRMERTT